MVRFRVHAHIVPVGREGQDVRRLVVGHVDTESGVHEQVAVLLLQEIGFRFQLTAQTAPLEYCYLIGFALLVDKHVGLSLNALPVPAKQVAAVVHSFAGLQYHDCQPD
nr:hypothetical protein PU94_01845 [Coprobacter secundus]